MKAWCIAILALSVLLSACSGPCTDSVLQRALSSKINARNNAVKETIKSAGEMMFQINLMLISQDRYTPSRWEIKQKGDGCVVTLTAEINGKLITASSFYVDLQQKRVFPDNKEANDIIRTLTSEAIVLSENP